LYHAAINKNLGRSIGSVVPVDPVAPEPAVVSKRKLAPVTVPTPEQKVIVG